MTFRWDGSGLLGRQIPGHTCWPIRTDHSFWQHGVPSESDAQQALNHPQRNVITRALRHAPSVDVDVLQSD